MSGYQNEEKRQQELNKSRLFVRVIEARGLLAADFGGTSDPFAELRIKHQTKVEKTRTIKKTLNPMWNEEFILYPTDIEKDFLSIKIYDFDEVTNNDFLGEIEIPVASISSKPINEEWRQLLTKKGSSLVPHQGEIKISATLLGPGKDMFASLTNSNSQPTPNQQQTVIIQQVPVYVPYPPATGYYPTPTGPVVVPPYADASLAQQAHAQSTPPALPPRDIPPEPEK